MNAEKLKKIGAGVRTGGPGSVRRKKLVKRPATGASDKNVHSALKKISTNRIPCDEVRLYRSDKKRVVVFNKPAVTANIQANTVIVQGKSSERDVKAEDMSDYIDQAAVAKLMAAMQQHKGAAGVGDDIPDVVGDFEQAAEVNAEAEAAKTDAPKVEELKE